MFFFALWKWQIVYVDPICIENHVKKTPAILNNNNNNTLQMWYDVRVVCLGFVAIVNIYNRKAYALLAFIWF